MTIKANIDRAAVQVGVQVRNRHTGEEATVAAVDGDWVRLSVDLPGDPASVGWRRQLLELNWERLS